MRHLIDARAPITLQDIDKAINDAHWWLDEDATGARPHVTIDDLIARLLAIAEEVYGPPAADVNSWAGGAPDRTPCRGWCPNRYEPPGDDDDRA